MKTIQLRDELEFKLIQYILETSKDKSVKYVLNRLEVLKIMIME